VPRAAEVENALKTAPSIASPGFYLPQRTLDFNNGTDGASATALFDDGAGETYYELDNPYNAGAEAMHGRTWALASGGGETTFEFGGYLDPPGGTLGEGDEVWLRIRMRWPTNGWEESNPHLKFMRLRELNGGSYAGGYTDMYIDTSLGAVSGSLKFIKETVNQWYYWDGNVVLTPGIWQTIEWYVKLSTDSSVGVVRLFVDGQKVQLYADDSNSTPVGDNVQTLNGGVIDALLLFTYWNAGGLYRPAHDQYVDIEDYAIATNANPPPIRNNGFRMIDPGV